jgi:hypothetical protein
MILTMLGHWACWPSAVFVGLLQRLNWLRENFFEQIYFPRATRARASSSNSSSSSSSEFDVDLVANIEVITSVDLVIDLSHMVLVIALATDSSRIVRLVVVPVVFVVFGVSFVCFKLAVSVEVVIRRKKWTQVVALAIDCNQLFALVVFFVGINVFA